jgi:hypothetical protein
MSLDLSNLLAFASLVNFVVLISLGYQLTLNKVNRKLYLVSLVIFVLTILLTTLIPGFPNINSFLGSSTGTNFGMLLTIGFAYKAAKNPVNG